MTLDIKKNFPNTPITSRISVVIPFINQDKITVALIDDIARNSIRPFEIIMIDNGSDVSIKDLLKQYNHELDITYIRKEKNIGVNPAWNLGISKSTGDLICVLNNDLIISYYFFESILKLMDDYSVGICVPNTVGDINFVRNSTFTMPIYQDVRKREGWAFTIRKCITDKIPPIPKQLNRVCGDDYLFYWSNRLGYHNVKILNNYIYHYGSTTTVKELQEKGFDFPDKDKEKEFWFKLKQKYDGGKYNVTTT